MKANAPERLYLSKNIYSTYLYQVPDPDDETAVEYIRTDAFIEETIKKACKYLEDHLIDFMREYYNLNATTPEFIEKFRKALEK